MKPYQTWATWPTVAGLAVATASSLVLLLGGCASSAGIAPVAQLVTAADAGIGPSAAAAPSLGADWWRAYGDPALDALVERTLAAHPSLKVAQARLARAQAGVDAAQTADGPQLNAVANATRQRFSATSIYPPPLGGSIRTLGTAQLEGSWEFDFFGRHRSAIEAATGSARAAQADMAAARNVLAASVARTWAQLGRLQEQRTIAQRTLQQREELLALVKQRVQGGLDTQVELRQGEGALPDARVQIEQLDEQITLARHALAALSAQKPDALDGLIVALRKLPTTAMPADLPADLLGRRADITAARWRVEAATSDMQNARTQFYPNINLTAFAGLSSIGLDRLVRAGSEQYGAGPALRLPIFDAGRLRANLRGKAADLDAAIESYNSAVLEAVHEVADQLGSLGSIARQQGEQARAQADAEAAYGFTLQRYRAGLGTYLVVLNAEAAVLSQRRLATDLRGRALETQIALIRSLGGGYTADAEPAARGTPAP